MAEIIAAWGPVVGLITTTSAAIAAILDVRNRLRRIEERTSQLFARLDAYDVLITQIRIHVAQIETRCARGHGHGGEET